MSEDFKNIDDEFKDVRARMVELQIKARGVRDERVLTAMREVRRHLFVRPEDQRLSYADHPLQIGLGQTISQPYIVAAMSELLELKEHSKVLEVGTGCGYQTAILAELGARIYSLEIVEELHKRAKQLLEFLGVNNIHLKLGSGFDGWCEAAPFDAIIVTCAPEEVPQSLVDQLADGGRMVIPVGHGVQTLKQIRKQGDTLLEKDIIQVSFVPMK